MGEQMYAFHVLHVPSLLTPELAERWGPCSAVAPISLRNIWRLTRANLAIA
jgi:hypothetical protein